jgi:hypothetical protein
MFLATMYRSLMIYLNFSRILAIEKLKTHLILALLFIIMAFWLYITKKGYIPPPPPPLPILMFVRTSSLEVYCKLAITTCPIACIQSFSFALASF